RLCFHLSGTLLDLHSFPTRRSSDLRTVVSFARTDSRALTLVVPAVVFQESEGSLELELPIYAPTDLTFGSHPVRIRYASAVDDLDRKSTRLNSSHGSISYAVFCLKK